jgi:transposase
MAKQTPITISGLERELLKQYAKTSPLVLVRFKSQTVLAVARGTPLEFITEVVDRKPSTITLWLRNWRKRRLASIFTGHQNNHNAGKLTPEQLAEVKTILQSPPSDHGLPKEFWDVPQLKHYVTAQFGVTYECDQSYYFLLKFSDLSFKYADTFDRKRDNAFILERMKAIRIELVPLMQADDWDVFAVDEVRMQQEAIIRRAWLRKGARTVIKVNRDKESQSYVGFLNQKTFACEVYQMDWQNSKEVLKACKLFLEAHPGKKICLVWDNAPFHKSKEIREALGKGQLLERVHLIAMPPYAPDNNPIEHVWNTTKQYISNIQHETFEQTKQTFSDFVASRSFNYSF